MKNLFLLFIATSVLLSQMERIGFVQASGDLVEVPSLSKQNDYDHRYVLFLQGITSSSSQNGSPLHGDFQKIEDHLRDQGFYRFVYFSYAAATSLERGELMCGGWGIPGCASGPGIDLGDLVSLSLSPEYTAEDTKISIDRQADALDWLIGQIIKKDPQAKIDIVGFSLGGVIATHWGSRPAGSSNYSHIHAVVIMGSPVGGIPLAGPFLEGCDTLDLICSFWRGKLMNWYGNEVAAQLQLPVNDPEASIVDDMRAVLQNPYFSLTSIQSTDDYTVNAKAIPLCVNLACTGYDDLLVGNGSQYWPSHIAHHNYSLGGLGIAEQPVSHSELDDYLSMNHSSTLRHRLTAEWVADALLAPGKEEQEEPIFTGSSSTILVFDTSGSMEDQDLSGLTKLEAAVDAGENILEIITAEAQAGVSAGNQIGVVNFSEDAWVGSELTTDMATVRSALAYLYADGGTALPKGFETAINLSNNSTSTGRPIIILLSDGMPNIGLNYEEDELIVQQQALDLASSAGSSGICVYTVGFGVPGTLGNLTGEASINEEFLTAIAERSGCGKYYNAQNATELANVYINLRHESVGELQFQKQGEISQDEQVDIGSVDIPANQDMMLFTLKWPGSQLDPVLIDPAGRSVDPGYPGASISQTSTLATVIIQSPKAGRWRVGAKGIDVPEGRTTYSAVISTRIGEVSSGYRVPGNRNTPPIILLIMLIVVGGGFVYVVSQRKIKTDAYLQITSAADGFKQVQINDQFVIGRSRFAQLRLTDRSVSRRHASIRYVKGSWFIQDLGSSGGTFVNGQRIQATRLNNGDQIRISNSTMIFRC